MCGLEKEVLSQLLCSVLPTELAMDIVNRKNGKECLYPCKNFSEISPRLARSRRVDQDLGEISVILGENFSGQKISARSRRDRVNLVEVSEISPR